MDDADNDYHDDDDDADENDYHGQLLEHMDGQVSPSSNESAAERHKSTDLFSSADLHRGAWAKYPSITVK